MLQLKSSTCSLVILSLLCGLLECYAFTDTLKVSYKPEFKFFPTISYSPETRLALGTSGMCFFRLNPKDTVARLSMANLSASFTQNKQVILNVGANIFSTHEKYWFRTNITYTKFPMFFYGIGNDAPLSNEERIFFKNLRFALTAMKQIKPKFFMGIGARFAQITDVKWEHQGLLERLNPVGKRGSRVVGLTFSVLHDNRDNQPNPSKGTYLGFDFQTHNRQLGSEFAFKSFAFDARKYWQVHHKRHILAWQFVSMANYGEVPFTELVMVGGEMIMRGYYWGRYREKQFIASQIEYRLPLHKYWGIVVFVGGGGITDKWQNWRWKYFHHNYGIGVRFKIIPSQNINLRIDYGRGEDSGSFYFGLTEAF